MSTPTKRGIQGFRRDLLTEEGRQAASRHGRKAALAARRAGKGHFWTSETARAAAHKRFA